MKIVISILKGIAGFFVSLFGLLGWLLKTLLELLAVSLVLCVLAAMLVYIKVKPDLDHCREVAYDKLAQMERQDFRMLSDTEVYDKDGALIGLINAGHYEYVPINRISLNIQNAYIAQEDRRFKTHTGVDWIATARASIALVKNKGVITQGGSTITQQVIKNTYLTQERSFTRKMVEILLAPEVEKKYSKADIMEFYCNTNFYGNHCYGVQAASRYYFGKDAADLTAYEAAVLVGLSNSPSAYDPVRNPEDALAKRNDVLRSMNEVGYLTKAEYESCIKQPLSIVQEEAEGTDENYMSSYAIHCAALDLMRLEDFPFQYTFKNKQDYTTYMDRYQTVYNEKNDEIRAGGYRIYTSLDQSLQAVLQNQIDTTLAPYTELQDNGKFALQGAGVIVDNLSNYVVAIVGGRGADDIFNRAYLSARQPGSTIKPLIDYAPAFDTGEYYPARLVDDHKWEEGPDNSGNHYYGEVTIREALNRSLNTVAWQVLSDIGVNFGLDYLGQMEFQRITYIDNDVPSLSIGGFTNGLRVVDMAKGYSTLANNGIFNNRTCIVRLEHEQQGDLTKDLVPKTRQVYQEDTAYMITDILKGTFTTGYGTGRGLGLANGMPCAGKTGTTNSSKDTWFCGYTRYYTTAIWMGYDIPRAMPGIFGATYSGRIWKAVMDQIHEGLTPLDWERPATVEEMEDEKTGITDLMSVTARERAEQSIHEKEQRQLVEDLERRVQAFEAKTIETVEDTYWVKEQYQYIVSNLNLMDDGDLRGNLLERTADRYDEFSEVIEKMKGTIALYEKQKERERAEAQARAEKEAAARRVSLEEAARKNEFLSALMAVESLQYQAPNAQELAQNAISKLPLVAGYPEASSYSDRLNAAIARISTLPTPEEWEKMEQERKAAEESQKAVEEERMRQEQRQLESTLREEQRKWEAGGPGMTGQTQPSTEAQPAETPAPETTAAPETEPAPAPEPEPGPGAEDTPLITTEGEG